MSVTPIEPDEVDPVRRDMIRFVNVSAQIKMLETEKDKLKKRISAVVEQEGVQDDKGHDWLEVEGIPGLAGFQRQHRKKIEPNEDAIDRVLRKHGIREDCFETVEVLNSDTVMQYHTQEVISDDEMQEMFPTKVSYAFVPVKP